MLTSAPTSAVSVPVPTGGLGRGQLWIAVVATATILMCAGTLWSSSATNDPVASLALERAVSLALGDPTGSGQGRLVSARVTDSRDATVEFVVRDQRDGQANRAT